MVKKNIHVFDLDRTITKIDTFRLFILYYLYKNPRKFTSYLRFLLLIPLFILKLREGRWFKEKFLSICLKNDSYYTIDNFSNDFSNLITKYFVNDKVKRRIDQLLKKKENEVLIISASFHVYVAKIGSAFKIKPKNVLGTKIDWREKKVSGKINGDNLIGKHKVSSYQNWLNLSSGFKKNKLYFYSDHHRDIPFFEISDEKILVNPTKKLRKYYDESHNLNL
tara:strand:+ start:416 stop:1081 length:666 start_codon:yes stop_codon:yes gene_type:complete